MNAGGTVRFSFGGIIFEYDEEKNRKNILFLFTGTQVEPTPVIAERAAEAARSLCFCSYASIFTISSMEGRDVICGWRSPGSIGLSMFPMSR